MILQRMKITEYKQMRVHPALLKALSIRAAKAGRSVTKELEQVLKEALSDNS